MDGRSFASLIGNPDGAWDRPSFTSYGIRYSSVRSPDFRYIQYPDGSEELYKYDDDPREFTNLTGDPQYTAIKEKLKGSIPTQWQESTGGRLEVPHDYDKVMRPRGPWDRPPSKPSRTPSVKPTHRPVLT
jgi:hypothetical protein